MGTDLGLSSADYSLCVSIFFVGQLFFYAKVNVAET